MVWKGCRKTRLNRKDSFEKNEKRPKTVFWSLLSNVSQSPVESFFCHCTNRGPVWCGKTRNIYSICFTVFSKLEMFTIGSFLVTLGFLLVSFLNCGNTILMPLHIKDSDMVQKHYMLFCSNLKDRVWENWVKSRNGSLIISGQLLLVCQFPVIQFRCNHTHMTLIWCQITVQTFVRIARTVLKKKMKNVQSCLLGYFWANFDKVSQIPARRVYCHCINRNLTRRGKTRKFRSNRTYSFWWNWWSSQWAVSWSR